MVDLITTPQPVIPRVTLACRLTYRFQCIPRTPQNIRGMVSEPNHTLITGSNKRSDKVTFLHPGPEGMGYVHRLATILLDRVMKHSPWNRTYDGNLAEMPDRQYLMASAARVREALIE